MAISTYSELVTALQNWTHRSDLDNRIPEFIALAEARFYQGDDPIRIPAMQNRDSGTSVSAAIALPTGYLATIRLSGIHGGVNYQLEYKSPDAFADYEWQSGIPGYYTMLEGEMKLAPDNDIDYIHDYYKRLDPLSVSNTTNWILTNAPGVYLYGSLLEAAPFMGKNADTAIWLQMYQSALAGANSVITDGLNANAMRVIAS